MCGGSPLMCDSVVYVLSFCLLKLSGRKHRRGGEFYTLVLPSVSGYVLLA